MVGGSSPGTHLSKRANLDPSQSRETIFYLLPIDFTMSRSNNAKRSQKEKESVVLIICNSKHRFLGESSKWQKQGCDFCRPDYLNIATHFVAFFEDDILSFSFKQLYIFGEELIQQNLKYKIEMFICIQRMQLNLDIPMQVQYQLVNHNFNEKGQGGGPGGGGNVMLLLPKYQTFR